MKTVSMKKWFQGSMTKVAGFAAVAVLSLLTTACGNSSGGGSSPGVGVLPYTYGASCAGCSAMGGSPIASAIGQTTYYGAPNYQLQISFYGNAAQVVAGVSYYGQVAATAQLVVQQNMQCGGYGGITIPAGVYNMQTQQPGTWSGQSFAGLAMIGVGPTQISMVFQNNFINNGRVQGNIAVSSTMGTCTDILF